MAGHWRALRRMARLLAHLLRGMWLAGPRFQALPLPARRHAVEVWAQGFLQACGIQLVVQGQPADGPVLVVANHQSWLDIPTLHAARHCRFVSKAEVAGWPLLGRLSEAAGTLFVQRGQRRATQRTVQAMAAALQAGDTVGLFPEGTVGSGHALLPFHGNMLQAAIDASAPVQPVALRFVDGCTGAPSYAPCEAYLDEPMARSLWRTLQAKDLVAVLHYGSPQLAQGQDRRSWAVQLQAAVEALRQPVASVPEDVPASTSASTTNTAPPSPLPPH